MNPNSKQSKSAVGVAVALAFIAVGVTVYWFHFHRGASGPSSSVVAAEKVIVDFYTGLAALDVEENERAARVLEEGVATEPGEPALWANLAVAQLRLNEPARARESLRRALELAGDSRELALLTAQLLEYSGAVEPAIAELRKVHEKWPENVAATYSLVSLLGQLRSDSAEAERLSLLADILRRVPDNLRARSEQARLAATLGRGDELRGAIDALQRDRGVWPDPLLQQLTQADEAARAGDFRQAALSLTFFENLLKPRSEYQQSLVQLGIQSLGTVGTPLRSLLRLKLPANDTADADVQLTFELQDPFKKAARPDLVLAMEQPGERRSTLLSLSNDMLHVDESAALPFPGSSIDTVVASIAVTDLNSDFQQDLICVGTQGCRIFLGTEDGSFMSLPTELDELDRPWHAVWTVDVEADGDMDLLLSDDQSSLQWIRNNGDSSFSAMDDFLSVAGVVSLCGLDFDLDGDVDLITLDASGSVVVWRNERGGNFTATSFPEAESRIAIAVADIDRDGLFDLVSLGKSGVVRSAHWAVDDWTESHLLTWSTSNALGNATAGEAHLAIVDIDNNGGADIVASLGFESAVWLRTADSSWLSLSGMPAMRVTSIVDRNRDGRLDLVGMSESAAGTALNRSQAGYGWLVIQPRANNAAGDKRINSFGIGGRIEIRAGNLVQANAIQSPRVQFGLGRHPQADVARIIWPNGTTQAEFDLRSGEVMVANQRLKGSCPWVFTFDGQAYRFVKDFIWRSPLGLRINAQSTAGITQTEDWIKISGDQLAAVEGHYRLRITAELWETHFFDHISLLAVDHPPEVDVFVDERFVPQKMPSQQITAVTRPQTLRHVTDEHGNRLDEVLRSNDGAYADGFALGDYQGVAAEHWVEFDLPREVSADRTVMIVGRGWIYPTDSSLNVALDQGDALRPFGLILEQQYPTGQWITIRDHLGFPAGKNKDVLLQLPGDLLDVSRRFRLRTNMEVYWDSLRWSYVAGDVEPRVTTLATTTSTLRYRGFSRLLPADRRRPDTPIYEVASSEQRWLDLEGFYTRFGDVRELLRAVDDRYVIVNAGDELVFEFDRGEAPPEGWQRDFVLVGDGWVKDGDFNTAFSQSVRPLPSHSVSEYLGPLLPLEQDPVYQRHPDDWRSYHTRYVTPDHFHHKLWRPSVPSATRENP